MCRIDKNAKDQNCFCHLSIPLSVYVRPFLSELRPICYSPCAGCRYPTFPTLSYTWTIFLFLSLNKVMINRTSAATPKATGTKMTNHVGLSTQLD